MHKYFYQFGIMVKSGRVMPSHALGSYAYPNPLELRLDRETSQTLDILVLCIDIIIGIFYSHGM